MVPTIDAPRTRGRPKKKINVSDSVFVSGNPPLIMAVQEALPFDKEPNLHEELNLGEELKDCESVEFKNGENILAIKLFKKANRLYRLQIFLNDTIEIRNTTYNGSSTALNFWNLLKEVMKK